MSFKEDEYVRWKNSPSVYRVLTDSKIDKYWHDVTKTTEGWKFTGNFEPWEPIEGEYVIPKIIDGKEASLISGFSVVIWKNGDSYDCVPFIGDLPCL